MIEDEERHVDFLEAQLHALHEMGLANYLSEQMHEDK
jgi:bacterioferritin (cytochrome b1)